MCVCKWGCVRAHASVCVYVWYVCVMCVWCVCGVCMWCVYVVCVCVRVCMVCVCVVCARVSVCMVCLCVVCVCAQVWCVCVCARACARVHVQIGTHGGQRATWAVYCYPLLPDAFETRSLTESEPC